MTTEELLALPDDGIERWLINGQLREKPPLPRDPLRTRILSPDGLKALERIAAHLGSWLEQRSTGTLVRAETSCRVVDGSTLLVVEVPYLDTTYGEIWEMIDGHLNAGVPLLWYVNPYDCTIIIYRLGTQPELVNTDHELTAEPHLPGFRVAVKEIFE